MNSMACWPSGATWTSRGRFSGADHFAHQQSVRKIVFSQEKIEPWRNGRLGVLRDGEEEGCSFAGFGFDPDSSAIALNHALANSQSDAGAAVFLVMMEPLEYAKDFLLVLGVDADAVVLHRKAPHGRRGWPPRCGFAEILRFDI